MNQMKKRKNMKKSTIMKNKKLLNMNIVLVLVLITAMLGAVISGCSSDTKTGESQDPGKLTVNQGEHKRDSDETDEGEESGNALTLSETYDVVRNGVRLIMNYDKKSNSFKSFKGILKNTTGNTLTQVRVEVHLSNGTELGPTTPVDLAPGEKVDVILPAQQARRLTDAPPAEVGAGSSEEGGEHGGEDSESGGEHGASGD